MPVSVLSVNRRRQREKREREKRERKREKARKTERERRERERKRERDRKRERERKRDTKRQREWFAKSETRQEIAEGGDDQTGSMTTRKRPPTWRCLHGMFSITKLQAADHKLVNQCQKVKPKSLNSTFEKEVPLV